MLRMSNVHDWNQKLHLVPGLHVSMCSATTISILFVTGVTIRRRGLGPPLLKKADKGPWQAGRVLDSDITVLFLPTTILMGKSCTAC